MKKNALLLAFGFAAFGLTSLAQAQTCASPIVPGPPSQSASGDTCAAANDIGTFCGLFPSPDNDVVTRFNIDATRTATSIAITTSTATWNFRAFLLQGSCGVAATCADSVDSAGEGGAENLAVGALGNGTYYLVVNTSGDPSTANCGAFTWVANGRLPVQLKNFSID